MGTSTNNLIVLKQLEGNSPVELNAMQQFFAPHVDTLIMFWILVWCATSIFLLIKLAREYLDYRKRTHR